MTKTQYRALYIGASLLSLSLSAFQSQPVDSEANWKLLQAVSETSSAVRLAMAYALPVVTLVSFYGIFRFRSWAPWLSLTLAIANICIIALYGTSMMQLPPAVQALQTLSCYIWGAVLALPFISSAVREMFWPTSTSQADGV